MQRLPALVSIGAFLGAAVASGCGGGSSPEAAPPSQPPPKTATTGSQPDATIRAEPSQTPLEDFDPGRFDRSTEIDNEWFPLRPGARLVYEGSTVEGGRRVPHRLVLTVTDLTKVIADVGALVAWEQDYSRGRLVENELVFFAQDSAGNVWQLGQYPEEYEDGNLVDAPAWIAGFENARPGIVMKAQPRPGAPSYSQGWGPAVNWTDRARARRIDRRTCVPAGCSENVLVTEEFSQEEPGAFQLKHYARGVGNVRVDWRGDDPSKEVLVLTRHVQLGPDALAAVRADTLRIERRAYEISADVYGRTPPAESPE